MPDNKHVEAINKLIEDIAGNPSLRDRVRDASLDELMAIAEERGLDIPRGQLKKALREQGQDAGRASTSNQETQAFLRNVSDWSG